MTELLFSSEADYYRQKMEMYVVNIRELEVEKTHKLKERLADLLGLAESRKLH